MPPGATRRVEDIVSPQALGRLRAWKAAVERALPGHVAGVLLFGSRARGEARPDSDYDLAGLLRGGPAGAGGLWGRGEPLVRARGAALVAEARAILASCARRFGFPPPG